MLFRLARAWHVRPAEILRWDYWTEYVPAIEQLKEIPIVDEVIAAVFRGKSKKNTAIEPMKSKADRLAAFEKLKKEAELRQANHG